MRRTKVLITIPIYKEIPTEMELISLRRCFDVLNKYPIALFVPKDLNISYYIDLFPKLKIEYFDPKYFKSTNTYNQLMLSKTFYERFIDYEYILIYQPDAYVFKDELEYWCNKNYDYIGAPWVGEHLMKFFKTPQFTDELPKITKHKWFYKLLTGKSGLVGNGGFSLRKTDSIIKVLEKHAEKAKTWSLAEDNFFGMYIQAHEPDFKIPNVKTAAKFSIENSPEIVYKMIGEQLPFGCHNWYGMFSYFWKKHIPFGK